MLPRALWLLVVLCAGLCSAQEAPRLYAHTGYALGSARQLSLGGAYVGIAEGGTFTANHASLGQPSRWLDTHLDGFFSLQATTTVGGQDLDNDRRVDRASVRQLLLSLGARYRRLGLGLFVRTTEVCVEDACAPLAPADASFSTGGLSLALAFFDGQLVTAAGLHGTQAALALHPGRTYAGGGLGLDLLWRPHQQPYRIGAVYRPLSVARPEAFAAPPSALRTAPSAVTFPAVLSVGVAAKLDSGREGLNLPRERDDDPTAPIAAHALVRDIFRNRRELPPGRLLGSVQLDLVLPVKDAVTVDYFVSLAQAAPVRVGTRPLLTPRAGLEHVTVPGRLRLRGGSYLEPSPTPGVPPRLHGTFGFDLFLFHLLFDWGVTGAFDVAPRVRQGSLSFGIWG